MTLMNTQFVRLLKSILCLGMLFLSCFISAEAIEEEAIQAPVNELHTTLISIMQAAEKQSFQERYDIMEKTVLKHFDSPLIAKVILGRYWKTLDQTSQTEFIDLFNQLTIATYVDRFDSYEGETFKNLAVEQMKENRFMVKTEFLPVDDEPISFNYIIQSNKDKWKIISVIADGINDLSLKRADYSAVIKDQGFDALITTLKEKISALKPKS